MGNGRCERSRKNKKSEPEEPKQRRRGLGVAELERLLRESNGYGHHLPSPHVPFSNTHNQLEAMRMQALYAPLMQSWMGIRNIETMKIRYGESQPRWNPNINGAINGQQYWQQGMGPWPILSHDEGSMQINSTMSSFDLMGSSSQQNSESTDTEELDLEIKL